MAKKSKHSIARAMDCEVPERPAPRLTLNEDDIKGLKDLKVGDTHEITIKAKLVALRKDEYGWEENEKLQGTFKVVTVDNKDISDHYDEDDE